MAEAQARAALAHDDAARFAQLAVDCARRSGATAAELARLLLRQAEALYLANRLGAALAACAEAADLAERSGRGDLLARAGLVVHGSGHPEVFAVVPPICRRALELVPADDHATRARLLAQLALGVAESEGGMPAAELAAQALAEADRSGDPTASIEAIAARHLAISIPQAVGERVELGRRVIELADAAEQPLAALWGHLWRAGATLQLGNLAEHDREVAEVDRIAQRRRSLVARWHHHRLVAQRAGLVGDFAAARRANQAALELGLRTDDISLVGLSHAFCTGLTVIRGEVDVPAGVGGRDRARAEDAAGAGQPPAGARRRRRPRPGPGRVRAAAARRPRLPGGRPLERHAHAARRSAAILLGDAEVAADVYAGFRDLGHYYTGDGSGSDLLLRLGAPAARRVCGVGR